MPQRLHRLEVRNKMLSISTRLDRELGIIIPPNHIISREAGYIDVYMSGLQPQIEHMKGFMVGALSREGIGIEAIETLFERRRRMWRVRFQNDLMLEQAQWGARGMSRNYRVRNGIDADASPSDTVRVRSGEQPAVSIHSTLEERDRNVREQFRQERERRQYAESLYFGTSAEVAEPLVEETQDEPDTGILRRIAVPLLALEESERG